MFAFGAPVLPSKPSSSERRDVYVLGAYPSGLHVSWTPPVLDGLALKSIRAMIVDNEPTPFWDGTDAETRFQAWRRTVGWQKDWGTVKVASSSSNGPSGKWVTHHIIKPLGVDRAGVCISDCLDESRLNAGQAARIADTYAPVAERLGLPQSTLRPVPSGESAMVKEAVDHHLDRLRSELRDCSPAKIVTLGNAALRVSARVLELGDDAPSALSREAYGRPLQVQFHGRSVEWLPLVHPRSGERTPPWPTIHTAWATKRA